MCRADYFSKNAQCSGYIIGVVDSITRVAAYDEPLRLPNGVTVGQLTKVVEKFIVDKPAEMHRPGPKVVAFEIWEEVACTC